MNLTENVTAFLNFLEAFYNPDFDTIRNCDYHVYIDCLDSCFKENKLLRQVAKDKLKNIDVKAAPAYSSKFVNFLLQYLGKMDAIDECSEALRFLSESAKFSMEVSSVHFDKLSIIFRSMEYFNSNYVKTCLKFSNLYESRLYYLCESVFNIFSSLDKNVDKLDELFKACKLALEKNERRMTKPPRASGG